MEVFNTVNILFILRGFATTIQISALAIVFSIVVGTVLAMVKQYCRGKLSIFRWIVTAYIELFRCTPNLLWILFIYFTMRASNFVVSVVAFTVFTSAVVSEIVRGGFNSIPKSQFEAAQSQGFGFFSTMAYIVLPQTFKTIIPALFSQCTTVIKDSSYLSSISVTELMFNARVVMASTSNVVAMLLLYALVFALYFVLNFGISLIVRAYQRRVVAA